MTLHSREIAPKRWKRRIQYNPRAKSTARYLTMSLIVTREKEDPSRASFSISHCLHCSKTSPFMSLITPARVFGNSRQQRFSSRRSTAEEQNSLARSVNNSEENSLSPWTLLQAVRFLYPLDGPSCTVEPILPPLPRPPRPPPLPLGRPLIPLL
jgi:hypothetical protein